MNTKKRAGLDKSHEDNPKPTDTLPRETDEIVLAEDELTGMKLTQKRVGTGRIRMVKPSRRKSRMPFKERLRLDVERELAELDRIMEAWNDPGSK